MKKQVALVALLAVVSLSQNVVRSRIGTNTVHADETPKWAKVSAQEPVPFRDPSPHNIQFVTVDENVKLEVLDWGGSGRRLVLLAGLGATAHVFDDFAPKLTPNYHAYGITRRGYGASSVPTSGYTADRLGDDVLAVLDAPKLNGTVLVGHSIAGEELSSVGTRHPERVAGLIYLDSAYSYAYYDRSLGDLNIDLQELKKKLDQWQPDKEPRDQPQLVQDLLQTSLPAFEKDLQEVQKNLQSARPATPTPPAPTAADRESFAAFRSWQKRVYGNASPEAQLRQYYESAPEGHVGQVHTKLAIPQAIIAGQQKYTDLRVPILAIFAAPHDLGLFANNNPVARAAFEARDIASTEAQAKAFESGVSSARVVRLPHANHAVFMSNEQDVLMEMRAFLAGLH
jgi:non-heme chloroperoxidase